MRKLFKDKRGVSPILTTVMLILLVVIAMSAVFAFFVSYVGIFQTGSGSAVMEMIEIEDVWFRASGTVDISIYNYGKIEAKITSVFVDDSLVINGIGSTVAVDDHLQITVPLVWDNSTSYSLKIVTERGSTFESEHVSPS